MRGETAIARVEATAYEVPTDAPESDGTMEWSKTTLVVVEIETRAGRGIGYTYAGVAAVSVVRDVLAEVLLGRDARATRAAFDAMVASVRNLGRPGVCAEAISACDVALWDLKAKLCGSSLCTLLGEARKDVTIYGSGGFTSYDVERLQGQLAGWVDEGMHAVKMKVGREPDLDPKRVRAAREAIGPRALLFVDANGAYARKEALRMALCFAQQDVRWLEEPVSSDDLEGLRLVRDRAPANVDVAAGEYGYDAPYFRRMLEAGAVDVLQADATRCLGVTGFVAASALAESFHVPLSTHCAPALHAQLACGLSNVVHLEWFHDHARIEGMLFEGALRPTRGRLKPDPARHGLGIELDRRAAERFRVGATAR